MHLDDAELQALIDGQLDRDAAERARTHLAECDRCQDRRETLDLATREARERLGLLHPGAPRLTPDDVMRSAERRTIAPRRAPRLGLWAAAIAGLLAVGAVAAAVLPGSPLRSAVQRALTETGRDPGTAERTPVGGAGRRAGVALVAGAELEIVFQAAQSEGRIELLQVRSDTVRVEASGDSVGFAVAGTLVRIANREARASYRILLPDGLPAVAIRVDDRTVYRRVGSEVLTDEFLSEGGVRRLEFPLTAAGE